MEIRAKLNVPPTRQADLNLEKERRDVWEENLHQNVTLKKCTFYILELNRAIDVDRKFFYLSQ